jgi:hypothetical protein
MQVVVRGEPHFPQNDRVTAVSSSTMISQYSKGLEESNEPGFPEAPREIYVIGVPTTYHQPHLY